MSKGKSFISEIGKYFKENDATSAMNQIMDITRMLTQLAAYMRITL